MFERIDKNILSKLKQAVCVPEFCTEDELITGMIDLSLRQYRGMIDFRTDIDNLKDKISDLQEIIESGKKKR